MEIVKRICKQCGKEFNVPPAKIKAGIGKFCSIKCRSDYRRESGCLSGENHPNWHGGKITRVCIRCGKEFKRTSSSISKSGGKFCSTECFHKYRGHEVVCVCGYCGKEFSVDESVIKDGNGKFCSHSCANKHHTGKLSHNWRGGLSFGKYCEKFNAELKSRVRAFWNDKCVICHKTSEQNNQLLSVHHVTYDKKICCNEEVPLFVPLCEKCHARTNSHREEWEIWFKYYIWGATDGTMKTYYTKEEMKMLQSMQIQ